MKNRIRPNSLIFLFLFVYDLLFPSFIFSLIYHINPHNPLSITISGFCILFFATLSIAGTFGANRYCYWITIKNESIIRRGFFFGFKLTIRVNSIISIKHVSLYETGRGHKTDYYVINDGIHLMNDRVKKSSSIFIPCNVKGVAFIRSFMNERIETDCPELKE